MVTSTADTLSKARSRSAWDVRKLAIKVHQTLAWFGAAALLLWGSSGLLHITMVTFGPQQAVFFPPGQALQLQDTTPVQQILQQHDIAEAALIKVVPGASGALLQVTVDSEQPRRYFALDNGNELPDHDAQQAIFLARHYLATEAAVSSTEFVTEFSADYPWVNRLLPVWKISFATEDHLNIYVHTETGSAASVSNDFKNLVQKGFGWLHTWDWMPHQAEWLRVLIIAVLIGSLLALALSGVIMLLKIRRQQRAKGLRGWHRMAGWVLVLPLIGMSFSGLFHLLALSGNEPQRILQLPQPMAMNSVQFPLHEQWQQISQGLNVNAVSLVTSSTGEPLYRLGLAADKRGGPRSESEIRNARFEGVNPTGPAVYMSASSGEVWAPGDRELAMQYAERHSGLDRAAISDMQLITRFGMNYDFRNKRLPVWRIDYAAPHNKTLFIDTASGALVDTFQHNRKPEQLSFSLLHKFNFLRMTGVGRNTQNLIQASVVVLSMIMMLGVGIKMDLDRRRRRRQQLLSQ